MRLRGVGWDHERCMAPLRAGAELWEARTGVRIEWTARTLQEFGDQPVEELTDRFDILSIDHPFVGTAHALGCLSPLDALIPEPELHALEEGALGPAHISYRYADRQWALATDGACQVAAARDDLLGDHPPPTTWDEVLALARSARGKVALPLKPADAICSLLSLCANGGAPPPLGLDRFLDPDVAEWALATIVELHRFGPPDALTLDPPAVLDRITETHEVAYTPLAFGYALYAAPGRRPFPCRYMDVPSSGDGPVGAILGGSGLAVSAASSHPQEAAAFAAWISGAPAQKDVVAANGGQPGSRRAWDDPDVDAAAGGFMRGTRKSHLLAYVRPRDPWWPDFQLAAGRALNEGLAGGAAPKAIRDRIERLYGAACRAPVQPFEKETA